ncbi:MAG: hypothetical protein LH647_13525, partial [Leptolyngbyaceae cyanobacterium CAN_BIN12]|nr:hypothetical protein [Leptolyngbyaceae cyanobacterium CAN_BIN12]
MAQVLCQKVANFTGISNGDGLVSLDDWYDYAYGKIIHQTPQQTPQKWTYSQQGELIIAKNPCPIVIKPAALPIELLQTIESPYGTIRGGAVQELERLLKGSDKALAVAALEMLEKMADDDSCQVQSLVTKILAEHETHRSETTAPPKQEPDRFTANVTAQSKPNLQPGVSKQEPDRFTANVTPTAEKAGSEAAGKIVTESARKFGGESAEKLYLKSETIEQKTTRDHKVFSAEQQSYGKLWFSWSLLNSIGWAIASLALSGFSIGLSLNWLLLIWLLAIIVLTAASVGKQSRFQLGWWILVCSIGGALGSGLGYSAYSGYSRYWGYQLWGG